MLKLLSPLLAPSRGLLLRPIASAPHPALRFYSQSTESPIAEQQKDDSAANAEYDEPEKLYSRVEIELRGSDPAVMQSYQRFAVTSAEHLGINVGRVWDRRRPNHERWTLLKSAFVHKKHRVQYEFRTYYKFMHFHRLTGSTLSTFLEYIQRNLPEGVAMKTTKVEILELPDHLRSPPAPVQAEQNETKA